MNRSLKKDSPHQQPRFSITGPFFGKGAICEPILRSLPAWFGIEGAIIQYIAEIEHLPTFLTYESGDVMGFLSIKQHYPVSAEVFVMGIREEAHRRGMGRALLDQAQKWLKHQGVEYLQVKTLGPSRPDENYAKTRAFYLAMGFKPLEEFPQIWEAGNPCLILIKKL